MLVLDSREAHNRPFRHTPTREATNQLLLRSTCESSQPVSGLRW